MYGATVNFSGNFCLQQYWLCLAVQFLLTSLRCDWWLQTNGDEPKGSSLLDWAGRCCGRQRLEQGCSAGWPNL